MIAIGTRIADAEKHLRLARHLDLTADRIECESRGDDGFLEEDAVAVLRWSAAYLRRPTMKEEDLEGVLAVFKRILPGFDFSMPNERVVRLPSRGLVPARRNRERC